MRCNRHYALFAGALIFAQNANSQQIPPGQQLNAPGKVSAVSEAKPASTNSGAVAQTSVTTSSAPAGAPNVITLSQAAGSAPAPAAASATAPAPSSVPPIVEYELATGKNSRKLDAAGPKEPGTKPRPAPALVLQRVSYIDNEPRALIKIHGVLRYFEVGSPLLKKVVTSITAEGVCLNPLENSDSMKSEKKKKAKGPACSQLISFDADS